MTQILAPSIAQVNLNFKYGAGATVLLTVADKLGNPIIDTSGCALQAQIKDPRTGAVLFEWNTTSAAGIGIASLTYSSFTQKSTASLVLTGAQSLAVFTFWLARWSCFITVPGHEPFCLAEGSVTVDV